MTKDRIIQACRTGIPKFRLRTMTCFYLVLYACLILEVFLTAKWTKPLFVLTDIVSVVCLFLTMVWFAIILIGAVMGRRWWRLLGAFVIKSVLFFLAVVIATASTIASGFIDADHFADDLTIPENLSLVTPIPPSPDRDMHDHDYVGNPPSPRDDPETDLMLYDSIQGGIYQAEIWANPREPGKVYLKAFEITQGTELSRDRLRDRSLSPIGYDDNPDHTFLAKPEFTIYEGNWGQYYAARIEVWFVPDNGGPERRLTARDFKIQGWQR